MKKFGLQFNITISSILLFIALCSLAVAASIFLNKIQHLNDQYGHSVGDLAISHLVDSLNNLIRGGDYIFRIGGEEFVIFIPDSDIDGGKKLLNVYVNGLNLQGSRPMRKRSALPSVLGL